MGGVAEDGAGAGEVPGAEGSSRATSAEALADVQARSLHAAGVLIDRIVHALDGPVDDPSGAEQRTAPGGGSADGPGARAQAGTTAGSGASDVAGRLAETWLDLLRLAADVVLPAAANPGAHGAGGGPGAPDGAVTWSVAEPAPPSAIRLEVTGGSGSAEAWLHNGTTDAVGPIHPRCGPLVSAEGRPLAGAIAIDPEVVPDLPGRSSRGLRLTVTVDGAAPTGLYRGLLQASGAPDLWLPVEVHVPEHRG
jgi:hypothetical protein